MAALSTVFQIPLEFRDIVVVFGGWLVEGLLFCCWGTLLVFSTFVEF